MRPCATALCKTTTTTTKKQREKRFCVLIKWPKGKKQHASSALAEVLVGPSTAIFTSSGRNVEYWYCNSVRVAWFGFSPHPEVLSLYWRIYFCLEFHVIEQAPGSRHRQLNLGILDAGSCQRGDRRQTIWNIRRRIYSFYALWTKKPQTPARKPLLRSCPCVDSKNFKEKVAKNKEN